VLGTGIHELWPDRLVDGKAKPCHDDKRKSGC
jgi:hypothetical protein